MTAMSYWLLRVVFVVGGMLAIVGTVVGVQTISQGGSGQAGGGDGIDLIKGGHWVLAGVRADGDGLRVRSSQLAIVQQDGSPGQANPPVNMYGTYLRVHGGFSVTIHISGVGAETDIGLYGAPPLIEDELRAEEDTLALVIKDSTLVVHIGEQRDGNHQQPVQYAIASKGEHQVTVTDDTGRLSFTVDGRSLGGLDDKGIFSSGQVWFGFDAPKAQSGFRIDALRAQAVGSSKVTVTVADSRQTTIAEQSDGLAALAARLRPGFLLGVAVAPGPLLSDSRYRQLLGNFNAVTTENVGKFQTIHPSPDVYNFSDMDAVVQVARTSRMAVQGHTLVFGEANPAWLQQLAQDHPDQLERAMTDHIRTVVGHYKGRVRGWDVVNEPLADYNAPSGDYGLRQNIWYKGLGPEYIATALRAAHKADPAAGLWINEFSLETDDERFGQMVDLIKHLQAEGAPLTGIGFQAHIDDGDTVDGDTHIDTSLLREHIAALAALGLKVRVSELDVSSPSEYPVFVDVIRTCLEESACTGVTLWGVTDRYSSSGTLQDNGIFEPGMGLPWDKDEQPLPPVDQIRQLFRGQ